MAIKNQDLRNLENQKKSVVSDYGSRMTIVKEEISSLSDKVSSGFEMRDVECLVEYHTPVKNKKRLTRSDNDEQWVEPMTDADFNLFNQWEENNAKEEEEIGGNPNVEPAEA